MEFEAELELAGERFTGQVQSRNRLIGITLQTGKKIRENRRKTGEIF